MPAAKQVTKDSEIVKIPGADSHVQETAVQDVVDTMSQDTAPEALFAAPAEHPVEVHRTAIPAPGSVTLVDGRWTMWGEGGTSQPYDGAMVEFVSRDPGLLIELGDVQVRFDLGRVKVPESVAARLKRHFLFNTDKFFTADEVAVIGNEIVSYRDHKAFSDSVARMKSGEVVMYATKTNPNLVMLFGDWEVRFEDGYAAVPRDKVERFENHMFVREQRVTRLQAV
jgi:hypothetical protein